MPRQLAGHFLYGAFRHVNNLLVVLKETELDMNILGQEAAFKHFVISAAHTSLSYGISVAWL